MRLRNWPSLGRIVIEQYMQNCFMYGISRRFIVVVKAIISRNHLLTIVFASLFLISVGMIVHYAFADTVSSTIPGVESNFISVNPVTNKIYADNEHTFFVIDGSTNSVTATIPFGTSSSLVGIGVNPGTNKIYVGDQNNGVHVIDGNTNSIIANVTVNPAFAGVVANPNTNKIYVGSGNLAVINGSTDTIKSSIATACSVEYLAVNPVTNKIYIPCVGYTSGPANGLHAFIYIIDGSTDTVVGQINMAWTGQVFYGIAVNPLTNTIYQTDFGNHVIYVFDGNTNSLTNTISASAGFIAVNPVTNKVYATDNANPVIIIDGSTNKVIQSLQVGNSPWGVSVNPNTNKIYVANSGSNFVSVIDGSSSGPSTVPSSPQNLQATVSSPTTISLSWTAPSSNGGSAITNYKIYRSSSSGTEGYLVTVGNVTSYTDTGLARGHTYFYKVTAVNSIGTSHQSNEAS